MEDNTTPDKMEGKLTIKELAPYYQYGLYGYASTCELKGKLVGLHGIEYLTLSHSINDHNTVNNSYQVSEFKPILRPLSDLTKEIEVNGERFVPMIKLIKLTFGENAVVTEVHENDDIVWVKSFTGTNINHNLIIDKLSLDITHTSAGYYDPLFDKCKQLQGGKMIYDKFYEWHFAIDIPEYLYVNINDL